ncbi:unnamed protein product [Microthlaspi erraticum]|uniref:HTH myb-type domain-containing protein n=1 Tax=Microthlaspi erraticum TaxID=1685480 RepID=A0A6D2IKJ0_9BRAS|nr:unnamed protein product [Microthlaspi erraticum]
MEVMSSDTNKEHESLTCGAMCFIPKPIKVTDLPKIYQLALNYKRNGKSVVWTENNHKDTYVSVPQQIQLLSEQANGLNTKKKTCSSRSMTSTNGSCVRADSSRKRKSNGSSGDDVESVSQPTKKKSKLTWTDELQDLFLQAIKHLTLEKAVPKKILEHMNVPYLTRENVASHLQKYRQFLRKVAEQGLLSLLSIQEKDSILSHGPIREPHYNYCTPSSTSWYETSLNNRLFYCKPGQGLLGQSRLLSNTREPVRFNQIPHKYMNHSSTNGPRSIGSNFTLPIKTNLNFSYQASQNVGSTFFEPSLMANKTGQSSQVLGFGQHGNNFNNNMMSSYGSLTPNQPGHSHFSYGVQSFLNNENSAYKTRSHAHATSQPTFEVPPLENLNLYDDLGNTNELPCDTSNFQFDHNKVYYITLHYLLFSNVST